MPKICWMVPFLPCIFWILIRKMRWCFTHFILAWHLFICPFGHWICKFHSPSTERKLNQNTPRDHSFPPSSTIFDISFSLGHDDSEHELVPIQLPVVPIPSKQPPTPSSSPEPPMIPSPHAQIPSDLLTWEVRLFRFHIHFILFPFTFIKDPLANKRMNANSAALCPSFFRWFILSPFRIISSSFSLFRLPSFVFIQWCPKWAF